MKWGRLSVDIALAAALAGCCGGCAVWGYHSVYLDSELVNENNCLLMIEGDTNLPDGVPVVAALSDNGNVLKRGESPVAKGQYSMVLDVSDLEGNERFKLDVFTEAGLWNDSQKDILGRCGQYMTGRQVEDAGGGCKLAQHFVVVLPMNKREAAIRRIKNGDYAFGVAALEDVVEQDSGDDQAIAWLALALVRNNQSERHLHSRAYDLLHSLKPENLPRNLRLECQEWLDRWTAEEEKARAAEERRRIIAQHRREAAQRLLEIVPGRSIADIAVGQEAKNVFKVCPLRAPLDWSGEVTRFDVPERRVTVFFDTASKRVAEIATESRALHHVSGLRVGSELERVIQVFPGGELVWDDTAHRKSGADIDEVTEVQFGAYSHPKGIVFGLKRERLGLGLSVETVTSIAVTAPNT